MGVDIEAVGTRYLLAFYRFYFFAIFYRKSIDYLCTQIYNRLIRNTETRNHASKVAKMQREVRMRYEEYEVTSEFEDEEENEDVYPEWSEDYLNSLGMSMSDFV